MGFIIFLILASLRRWAKQGGLLFSIYLIFNGAERFAIEIIRVNGEYNIFGLMLTQAQVIASILFVIGVVLSIYFYYKQSRPDFKQVIYDANSEDAKKENSPLLDK